MSHLDPYGGAEPRGWDRPERPAALPWPETEIEPGPWTRQPGTGPDLYAEPRTRPRPHADPYADRGGPHPPDPYDEGGRYPTGPYPDRGAPRRRDEREAYREHRADPYRDPGPYRDDPYGGERPDPYRERYGDGDGPGHHGGDRRGPEPYPERYDDRHPDEPGAYGAPPGRGSYDDAGYPTAQLEAVRVGAAPDAAAEPEPERPPGRRPRGKRRASADRPPTQPSRAGRNLPAAIGVGLALGALILLTLFVYTPAFLAVVVAAVGIGVWELGRAVRRSGAHPPLVPLVAGGALTVGLAWFAGPDALSLGLLVTVLGTMIWRLGDGPGGYQRDLTAATLIAVYVPFLGGFAALLAAAPGDGPWRILATLVAVVLSDTGGYAAGVAFGRHPMAPSVSPKKSWEGFGGSLAAAALGSALMIWQVFDVAPWWGALFGLAVSCAAVLGDLAESMIKRDLGVKDMSNLLPGHGGLMDRLDSILFAVPTAYLLLAVIVPVTG
ncbi:phosphatidate cytidylyltransferase [Micromonospora sp. URMC 103]|uniref:phosphatidate cytidylyltransferase n=1 Tax=Micromonospora sp. URMC 103 TaxID=3423406 RepID=UPI003F1D9575